MLNILSTNQINQVLTTDMLPALTPEDIKQLEASGVVLPTPEVAPAPVDGADNAS